MCFYMNIIIDQIFMLHDIDLFSLLLQYTKLTEGEMKNKVVTLFFISTYK